MKQINCSYDPSSVKIRVYHSVGVALSLNQSVPFRLIRLNTTKKTNNAQQQPIHPRLWEYKTHDMNNEKICLVVIIMVNTTGPNSLMV